MKYLEVKLGKWENLIKQSAVLFRNILLQEQISTSSHREIRHPFLGLRLSMNIVLSNMIV